MNSNRPRNTFGRAVMRTMRDFYLNFKDTNHTFSELKLLMQSDGANHNGTKYEPDIYIYGLCPTCSKNVSNYRIMCGHLFCKFCILKMISCDTCGKPVENPMYIHLYEEPREPTRQDNVQIDANSDSEASNVSEENNDSQLLDYLDSH